MLNKLLTLTFLLLLFFSCKNAKVTDESVNVKEEKLITTNLDWLVGTWIDSTSFKILNQTYVEVWRAIEKDSYKGMKYSIKGGNNGDTTNLKIDKSEGKFYYTIVEGNESSIFIQTKGASSELEFANTKDEFPYNINYLYVNNKLTITASGNLNGEQRAIKFNTLKK